MSDCSIFSHIMLQMQAPMTLFSKRSEIHASSLGVLGDGRRARPRPPRVTRGRRMAGEAVSTLLVVYLSRDSRCRSPPPSATIAASPPSVCFTALPSKNHTLRGRREERGGPQVMGYRAVEGRMSLGAVRAIVPVVGLAGEDPFLLQPSPSLPGLGFCVGCWMFDVRCWMF